MDMEERASHLKVIREHGRAPGPLDGIARVPGLIAKDARLVAQRKAADHSFSQSLREEGATAARAHVVRPTTSTLRRPGANPAAAGDRLMSSVPAMVLAGTRTTIASPGRKAPDSLKAVGQAALQADHNGQKKLGDMRQLFGSLSGKIGCVCVH